MGETSDTAMLEKLIERVEAKKIDLGEKTHRWPAAEYADPAIFRREREILFRRYPLMVGHMAQLEAPGSFFTHRLSGVPIVVTRNRRGELRAFLNICRHRGTLVEKEACGARRSFVCPYHAWTYDLDGKLVGIPDRIGFDDLDETRLGLVPLPVAERHGLIFVRPTAGPALDMPRYLGAVDAQVERLGVRDHRLFHEEIIEAKFNWKIGIDGAIEDYHFGIVHGKTAAHLLYSNAAKYDRYPPHSRLVSPRRGILDLKKTPRTQWRLGANTMTTFFIFPNTVLLLPGDHFIMFSVFPQSPNTSIVRYAIYVPTDLETPEKRKRWSRTTELSRTVVAEDFAVGESIQAALSSGADLPVHFGRCEQAVADFHVQCARAIAAKERKAGPRSNGAHRRRAPR